MTLTRPLKKSRPRPIRCTRPDWSNRIGWAAILISGRLDWYRGGRPSHRRDLMIRTIERQIADLTRDDKSDKSEVGK